MCDQPYKSLLDAARKIHASIGEESFAIPNGLSPSNETSQSPSVFESEISLISRNADKSSAFPLPDDIREKGQQMAEVYLFIYIVENYLRLFIEKVCQNVLGGDYFNKLVLPRSISSSITLRKEQEAKNQWISVRGGSDLYYLDFKDLGLLIQNNWNLFKLYFPDQAWIATKIDEMGNCRNLIAHNSILGEHERDVIRVNFRSILKQIKVI